MEALLFIFGIGLVAAGGISSSNRNARLRRLNEEFASHNYINFSKQQLLEQQANYIDYFGGFDTGKIYQLIMKDFHVNPIRAKEIMAVGLAKYFTEKYGFEYNFAKNRYGVRSSYNIEYLLIEDNLVEDYNEIMNMPFEERQKYHYIMKKSDAYRAPGRIIWERFI